MRKRTNALAVAAVVVLTIPGMVVGYVVSKVYSFIQPFIVDSLFSHLFGEQFIAGFNGEAEAFVQSLSAGLFAVWISAKWLNANYNVVVAWASVVVCIFGLMGVAAAIIKDNLISLYTLTMIVSSGATILGFVVMKENLQSRAWAKAAAGEMDSDATTN